MILRTEQKRKDKNGWKADRKILGGIIYAESENSIIFYIIV